LDLNEFLIKISKYAIPVLFAITLHEVAHGWTARYFGDRTAEMLGRLSLNPLRHIDPIGTVLVPGLLLVVGGPLFGWAKPVPVATSVMRNPRRATIVVALAGPAANLLMAAAWCAVLVAITRVIAITRVNGIVTFDYWIAYMAQAGILTNVILAVFNLLPIPPLDGGRVLTVLLPPRMSARLASIEPAGLFIALGLSMVGLFGWLFDPALRMVGRVVDVLMRTPA
jgi:Zn-dependent protease